MNVINHGPQCGYTVRMTRDELETFAARWPCYDGPRVGGFAMFTSDGDLIDLSAGWSKPQFDGAALSAIIDDMKAAINDRARFLAACGITTEGMT